MREERLRTSRDRRRMPSVSRLKKSKLRKMTSRWLARTLKPKRRDKPSNLWERLQSRQDNWKKIRSMTRSSIDLTGKEWIQVITSS